MNTPVVLGQVVELEITGYGHEAEGVGRYQNFTIFVPQAIRGELVKAEIVEVKKNFARAKLAEVLRPAPERIAPTCSIYDDCGGCQLQHLSYPAQLDFKRQTVSDALRRIGGLEGVAVRPTLGAREPWYYRNKVQYPFGYSDNTVVMGFFRKGTHRIVPVINCQLQTMPSNWVAGKVLELLRKYRVSIYNDQTGQGLLRHVLIKKGFKTGEIMVVFVTNGREFAKGEELAELLRATYPGVKSVIQNINTNRGNVILGKETIVLAGADFISDELDGLKFKISPRSFFQVNPEQTEVLYKKALEYAEIAGTETVLDAYCGVGSLTLFLARRAGKVYGVEVVPEAIRDAGENAQVNRVENVEFLVGRVEEVLPDLLSQGIKIEVATVDPPRAGCDPGVLRSLAESGVGRIVYVSCNPSTLARDLKILDELGYKTEEIQPVDMFPQTYHVECVARVALIP